MGQEKHSAWPAQTDGGQMDICTAWMDARPPPPPPVSEKNYE